MLSNLEEVTSPENSTLFSELIWKVIGIIIAYFPVALLKISKENGHNKNLKMKKVKDVQSVIISLKQEVWAVPIRFSWVPILTL